MSGPLPPDWTVWTLKDMGVPVTPNNIQALVLMSESEGTATTDQHPGGYDFTRGVERYNYINTVLPMPGSQDCLSCSQQSVQDYPNGGVGVQAASKTLQGWPSVLSVFKSGDQPMSAYYDALSTEYSTWGGSLDNASSWESAAPAWSASAAQLKGYNAKSSTSGGGGGHYGDISRALSDVANALLGPLGIGVSGSLTPAQGILSLASVGANLTNQLQNLFTLLAWITNPLSWLRIFCGFAGLLFAAGGTIAMVGVF